MDVKKYRVMDYIEIFVLILLTIGPIPPFYKVLLYFAVLLVDLLLGKIQLDINISRDRLLIPVITIIAIMIAMVIDIRNVSDLNSYSLAGFAYLLPFVFCLIYFRRFSVNDFLCLCEKVAFFLCICSLIGFLLQTFWPSIILRMPSIVFYGRRVYTVIFYGAIPDWTGQSVLMRNCGCAFEPGAFQFLMNFGIAICFMEIRKKSLFKNLLKISLYVIAIATTLSTAGLFILALVFLFNSLKNRKVFLITIIIAFLFFFLFRDVIFNQVIKYESGNFESRFSNSLFVIKNYWSELFGVGSTGYDAIYSLNKDIGSWDLYTNLFIRYGYPFIILFIFSVVNIRKINFSIMMVVLLTFLSESLLGPITVMLMFYSFGYGKKKPSVLFNGSIADKKTVIQL